MKEYKFKHKFAHGVTINIKSEYEQDAWFILSDIVIDNITDYELIED